MKNNKFIKSTLILLVGGFITKILGMIIRIVMTRLIGTEGIGLYMLIMPTFSLFIGLAHLGMPISISKLVSEDKKNNKNLLANAIPLSLAVNIFIIVFLLFSSHFIADNLLKDSRCFYGLVSIGLVLPFISISNILRGYFFGKQRMMPHVISNITEDIIRLVVISLGIPFALSFGIEFAVGFIVLSNIISELTSILILFFFLPKNFSIKANDLKFNRDNVRDILKISIPTTTSRLIGNIGYFFEPIIITFVLLKVGYSNSFILNEYGIINGYVMPLVMLPSFFTMALSQAILPIVSNSSARGNYDYLKGKIRQAITLSLIIGIPVTILFVFYPHLPLNLIYNTNEGLNYIKVIAPICLLHYIQAPLTSVLQGLGLASEAMKDTVIGMFIRTFCLFFFSFCKIGMWGLIIATCSNIMYVTFMHIKKVRKALKFC